MTDTKSGSAAPSVEERIAEIEREVAVAEDVYSARELAIERAPISYASVRLLLAELRARDEALREARKMIEKARALAGMLDPTYVAVMLKALGVSTSLARTEGGDVDGK